MYFEKEQFLFSKALEDNWTTILKEYQGLKEVQKEPWFEKEIYNGDWKVFGLFNFDGSEVPLGKRCCPITSSIIHEHIPDHQAAGFSILKPNTVITPHRGYSPAVLRCHLGLIIPENCALSVASVQKPWEEGKVMVFDDTYEHSAWNKSDKERVILLIDFKKKASYQPMPRF